MDTVNLGGAEVRLGLPKSYSVCFDVVVAAGQNTLRAFCAALGLCWQGKGRPRARYDASGYNALAYGGQVLDELVARGLTPGEVHAAGAIAFNLMAEQIITEDEVADAEGNSEAPEPSTT